MGSGPNYVLDKGFLATGGSVAYSLGELVKQATTNFSGDSVAKASAGTDDVIGVCQENVDANKVATGKVVVDIRLLGISRVIAGAAIAMGDRLVSDASARAVPSARAAAGAQPARVFGRALNAATAAGQHIDVLLTPGATY
jgi:hypothetical protein